MESIFEAIENNNLEQVKEIIIKNKNDKFFLNKTDGYHSPLMYAIRCLDREYELIKYLVEVGSDVNFKTSDGYTALHSNVDYDGEEAYGEMPFKIAKLLKDNGADTEIRNDYGWTPLMRATLEGTIDEFKALLQIGANYNVSYTDYSMPEFTRGMHLVDLCLSEPDKLRALVENGLKLNNSHLEKALKMVQDSEEDNSSFIDDLNQSIELIKNEIAKSNIR